jgi:hypothetical protein
VAVKPLLLIDPPNPRISMTKKVALQRGLRIVTTTPTTTITTTTIPLTEESEHVGGRISEEDSKLWWRRRKIHMHERQLADLSISHDGEYAFAVVQVLNEVNTDTGEDPAVIVDDGTGESIHEPELGDLGFDVH